MKKEQLFRMSLTVLLLAVIFTMALTMSTSAVTKKEFDKFDLNGDGAINISDVTLLLDYLSGNFHMPHDNGISVKDDGVRYYLNGEAVTGFYIVDGKKLYFDPETGLMQTTALEVDGFSYEAPTAFVKDGVTLYAYGDPIVAGELEYALNDDGNTYRVIGIGTVTGGIVSIPETYNGKPVTVVGNEAFCNCTSLTSVKIGNSVTSIGNGAFSWCTSLTSVIIPDSVTMIGDFAFAGCESLTSVTIPDSVISIGRDAFEGCTSLTSVKIGESVTTIGNYAFFCCTSLTSIAVSDNNTDYTSIDGNLYNKDGTTLIQYAIGKNDTSFKIPDSVKLIGGSAFSYCTSLTSVTIGDSVTLIGWSAFLDCTSLKTICYTGSEEQWSEINIGLDNAPLFDATKIYNYTGE